MSQSSNGIAPEVIRGVMPPCQLGLDLLQAIFTAIPAPPPDATTAWRHARNTRLTQEISALMPANANHFAYTKVETTILLYGQGPVEFKYVNPSDDPRLKTSTSRK